MSDEIPIVLFAYRRPDLLERMLACVRANPAPKIYAFSDGPADDSVADGVAQVRAMLRAVDWAPIEIHESPVNLGVALAEIRGISYVLERHEMAVMIEEDLEFLPGAYAFLCVALRQYRNEARVMGVTAWSAQRIIPPGVTQPYFSPRMSGLMWGTWRRAWAGMPEETAAGLLAECRAKGLDPSHVGRDMVMSVPHEVQRGFWDLRFNLHMLARGGLFLWPAASMVRHIGYDARATNSPQGGGWEEQLVAAPDPASVQWPAIVEHPQAASMWRHALAGTRLSPAARMRRRFERWFGV
jgi:hypothetical protein